MATAWLISKQKPMLELAVLTAAFASSLHLQHKVQGTGDGGGSETQPNASGVEGGYRKIPSTLQKVQEGTGFAPTLLCLSRFPQPHCTVFSVQLQFSLWSGKS